jgi:signal transduction histidine kinase
MRPAPRNHHETDDELFATKRPLSYETVLTLPDGRAFSVIVAKTPLLAEDGTVTGIASVITDISEQKRMRDAAEAAMHAKSRFLANMSHELRTPLNGVVGMASLLENTALDARQRRFVRTLKSSAEALITLINDVLDLSKAEAGKLELSLAPVDLRREIEQVVALLAARAHGTGFELAAHLAPGAPRGRPSPRHGRAHAARSAASPCRRAARPWRAARRHVAAGCGTRSGCRVRARWRAPCCLS